MTISQILVLSIFALLAGGFVHERWRTWILLVGSLLVIFWLQPSSPIRHLDYWLPVISILLTAFVWSITSRRPDASPNQNRAASLVILAVVVLVGMLRYIEPLCCLTATRPPSLQHIILALGPTIVLIAIPYFLRPPKRFLTSAGIVLILALFIVLKAAPLTQTASAWLRLGTGQSKDLASALDISWLGFSYLAFRLLHVLRDAQQARLPTYTLGEFAAYALFFPVYPAGPIDRVQRFLPELRNPLRTGTDNNSSHATAKSPLSGLDHGNLAWGGQRILLGAFKKFVLADSLALVALNGQNAVQVESGLWTWVLLYAFTLRIYFDFSGYTDIALGLGRLLGFRLPDNFDRPYIKTNLTAFWNSWHITLAQWFRAYYFNPLTRHLRTRTKKLPSWLVIFLGQFSTMLLIGLWHGITWNFAIWGAWHGLGLFVHNRWSEWTRPRSGSLEERPQLKRTLQLSSWFLTFNYVALGWVWFALPDPGMAMQVFQRLAGF